MGRPAGSLVRATCCTCGKQEMARGTSHLWRCPDCKQAGRFLPSTGYCGDAGEIAKSRVASAVRDGLLPRIHTLACVDCGKQAAAYEHRDYSKPLVVEPVCRSCNAKRGPAVVSGEVHVLSHVCSLHARYV